MAEMTADVFEKYYVIDRTLQGNHSVKNLIRLMQVGYALKVGERGFDRTPEEPQQMLVSPVNDVWLGFWPIKGPVERIYFNPDLVKLIKDETLQVTHFYDHDSHGRAMIGLRLTEERKRLQRLGLEGLLPGHAISLFLAPK